MYWGRWERGLITLKSLLPCLLENASGLGSLADPFCIVGATVFCRYQLCLLRFLGGSDSGSVGGIAVPTALAVMWFGCLRDKGFAATFVTLSS